MGGCRCMKLVSRIPAGCCLSCSKGNGKRNQQAALGGISIRGLLQVQSFSAFAVNP